MKIYIGADHQGFHLKADLIKDLVRQGFEVVDKGNKKMEPEDNFPDYAKLVVGAVLTSNDPDPRGILICGSGQGMSMFANRFKGIRASLVWSRDEARLARNDDDSNVLCLPAAAVSDSEIGLIIQTWLTTDFAGAPRFKRRLAAMDEFGS
ncbi:MAG TPA: RpiB/LacA/LacB family sugar-phosphate isomerase [Patescibacteria group bacterium]|jgi:ribose 5-phosphate isomerase B|nr:RpiB/LacA/LacB family sugar-phosphate isomerase [Patescibacteria group bacterium]